MPDPSADLRLGVVILGAGASSRMGRPKLVLPWHGPTILGHLIQQWHSLGATQLAVVIAPPPNAIHEELDSLRFPTSARIVNPSPEVGMFSSVQCAARWTDWDPRLTHFAILLGDQPQISRSTLELLMRHAAAHPAAVCQPSFAGRFKHPVILPATVFRQLATTSHLTLRDFLKDCSAPRSPLEIDDPSLTYDLDTPADYAAALKAFDSSPKPTGPA